MEELFRAYWPLIRGYLTRRTGDPGLGEELAQETFVRATRAFLGWRGEAPAAWLLAIARNVLAEHGRRAQRAERAMLREPPPLSMPPPEAAVELQDLLDRLPGADRQVLTAMYRDGLTHAEIAALLQTTPTAVKSRVWRARARLRALYRQGDEHD